MNGKDKLLNELLLAEKDQYSEIMDKYIILIEKEVIYASTVDKVMRLSEKASGLREGEILSRRKTLDVVQARFFAAKALKAKFGLTWEKIGIILNRDHATMIHGVRKITGYMEHDSELKQKYAEFEAQI